VEAAVADMKISQHSRSLFMFQVHSFSLKLYQPKVYSTVHVSIDQAHSFSLKLHQPKVYSTVHVSIDQAHLISPMLHQPKVYSTPYHRWFGNEFSLSS
jgi:hypothetical protein